MEQQPIRSKEIINYSALNRSVNFGAAIRSSRNVLVYIFVAFGFVAPIFLVLLSLLVKDQGYASFFAYMIIFLLTGGISYVTLAFFDGKNFLLQSGFAADNGFEYIAEIKQKLNGIFDPISTDGTLTDVIKGKYANSNFWFAEYQYIPNSVNGQKGVQVKTVIAYELPNQLPNIVLDSKNNNYLGMSIPIELAISQKLDLEGDFIKYFTFYVPKDYERDALYFLTPELMARIVDMCQDYDIEIIGSELRFYSNKRIEFTEGGLTKVFDLIEQVGLKFLENTKQYKDGGTANNAIQISNGTILKRSVKVRMYKFSGLIMTIIVIAWTIFITYFFLSAS